MSVCCAFRLQARCSTPRLYIQRSINSNGHNNLYAALCEKCSQSGQHTEARRGLVSAGLVGPALCLRPPLSSLSTPRPLPASRLLGRTNGPAHVSSLPPADLYYGGEAFSVEQPQAFTCPYCGRMGYTEMSLQEHVAAEHTETSTEVVGCTARREHTHTHDISQAAS